MHDGDDTLHFLTMIHSINDYPKEENNCDDDSIMFLPDDGHVGDTVITENVDLSSNSSFHIGGAKYRIHLRKIYHYRNYHSQND